MNGLKPKDVYNMLRLIFVGFILMILALGLSMVMGITKMSIEIKELTLIGVAYIAILCTIGSLAIGYAAMQLKKFK